LASKRTLTTPLTTLLRLPFGAPRGPRAYPVVAAMDLGMMVFTRGGRERSRAEFERLLRDAGFELRS
jgi:hypothetical protein